MAIIRAKQGVITRVLPHQGNRRYLIPGGTRGYPLGAGGITPTLDFNFAADKSLVANIGPTLTCTRASEATYFDASGVMQTASNNVARFDHDPSDSNASLGLLIEKPRTNLAIWTEDISNAAWVATNITKGSTSVTVPDGTASTTVRLTASAANGTLLQSITSTVATRVFSVFMKRVTGTGAIELSCDGVWIGGHTLTADWTRFDITRFSVTNPQIGVRIVTSGDAVDFWGADIQASSFLTSYIPNNSATASVTRQGDAVSTTDLSWYNNTAGTFYAHVDLTHDDNQSLWEIGDGAWTERWGCYRKTPDDFGGYVNVAVGTDNAYTTTASEWAASSIQRVVDGVAENDRAVYANGTQIHTAASVTVPSTPNLIKLGVGGRLADLTYTANGHIARIIYYDERLADSVLEDLSNGTFPVAASSESSAAGLGLTFGKMGLR